MKRGLSFCIKEWRNVEKEQTLQDFQWKKCKIVVKKDGFFRRNVKNMNSVFNVCLCVCLDEKKMQ